MMIFLAGLRKACVLVLVSYQGASPESQNYEGDSHRGSQRPSLVISFDR